MTRSEALQALEVLDALIELNQVNIIYNNFITTMLERSIQKPDGAWYLHGNYTLGGTVSGRLSSSKINLMNLPSAGSKYAKSIKKCFISPIGWLFSGADFASLEDRVSALTTKDPQKLKIYIPPSWDKYHITIDGVTHELLENTMVSHNGTEMTIKEYYEYTGNTQIH